MKDRIRSHIEAGIAVKKKILDSLIPRIEEAARLWIECLNSGQKILFFGNGGSASDAQHLAAELVGRFERERRALSGIALTTDTSILTSIANDYDYKRVFERQVEALGRKGDVAVGLTTSGKSPNVILAIERAKTMGLKTFVLTGKDGGSIAGKADCELIVPSDSTARIQECHIMIGHILCDLVEQGLLSDAAPRGRTRDL